MDRKNIRKAALIHLLCERAQIEHQGVHLPENVDELEWRVKHQLHAAGAEVDVIVKGWYPAHKVLLAREVGEAVQAEKTLVGIIAEIIRIGPVGHSANEASAGLENSVNLGHDKSGIVEVLKEVVGVKFVGTSVREKGQPLACIGDDVHSREVYHINSNGFGRYFVVATAQLYHHA